jgi:predicted helicase
MPKKPLAQIFHFDSFWKRQEKYDNLTNTNFEDVARKELKPTEPYYFFVPKDFWTKQKYDEGFSVDEIFNVNSNWIETHKDWIMIQFDKKIINEVKKDFELLTEIEIKQKYLIEKEWRDWQVKFAKNDINNSKIENILYRPFDLRYTLYSDKNRWVLAWSRNNVMQNFFLNDNLWLFVKRQTKQDFSYIFCSKYISESCVFESAYAKTQVFPLYLYTKKEENLFSNNSEILSEWWEIKTPNFNMEIIAKIEEKLGIKADFISETVRPGFMSEDVRAGFMPEDVRAGFMPAPSIMPAIIPTFSPENLFDYIYAVLHSKNYRETYKEFLKIDFPKIPFDVSKDLFFEMAHLWEELRSYHLMENENLIPKNFITKYEIDGDNLVEKVNFTPPKSPSTEGELW